ncbi:MAG: hypothetical protein Q8N05_11875 [Bacteroidota bacterium]|nr:hypothetical protein [Bacteroidota bacterium]
MELKDLKSAWDTYSSQEMDKHRLGKETIHELLKNRTKSLVERIDRNIWVGMAALLVFIAYVLLDNFFSSKILITEPIDYPGWLIPMDVFSNVLIVTTYVFFVLRYLRIKRSFSSDTQLKDLLTGILETLKTYRRMFYLAVIILLINITVNFTAGIYLGIKFRAGSAGNEIIHLTTAKILTIAGVGLLILIPLIALVFFFLRWGFNKLYGRYLIKLNETLLELDETDTSE